MSEDCEEEMELLLRMGADGKLHLSEPKPLLLLEFDTEDELKAAMEKIKEAEIIKKDGVILVKNVSLEFINSFSDPFDEYDQDDLSD
jgi:hypothetical protein